MEEQDIARLRKYESYLERKIKDLDRDIYLITEKGVMCDQVERQAYKRVRQHLYKLFPELR